MKRSAVLTLAGAVLVPSRPARSQALAPIKATATAVDLSAALFFAKDLGIFEKAGLDVDISTPTGNGITVPAVASGAVDIGIANIIQIALAFRKGIPVVVIAPTAVNDVRRPTNALLVPKDSPMRSARDLNGASLGTSPLKSLGDASTNAWLADHGGDPSTVKWLEIPYVAIGEAMAKDRIAAAFVLEPYATQLRPTTKVFARPYEAIGPRFLGSACIAGTAWANAHPDLVRRFASAMREASVWGNRNPKQSGIILAKYSNVSERTIATMTRAVYAEALVPAEIQPVLDFMAKNKLIDTTFPAQEMIFSRG